MASFVFAFYHAALWLLLSISFLSTNFNEIPLINPKPSYLILVLFCKCRRFLGARYAVKRENGILGPVPGCIYTSSQSQVLELSLVEAFCHVHTPSGKDDIGGRIHVS